MTKQIYNQASPFFPFLSFLEEENVRTGRQEKKKKKRKKKKTTFILYSRQFRVLGLVLWHIIYLWHCRLFNVKSIFIHTQFYFKQFSFLFTRSLMWKLFYFRQFSLA